MKSKERRKDHLKSERSTATGLLDRCWCITDEVPMGFVAYERLTPT